MLPCEEDAFTYIEHMAEELAKVLPLLTAHILAGEDDMAMSMPGKG